MANKDIPWANIFKALETWRAGLGGHPGQTEPSVTTVAEHYAHSPWAVLVSTILSLRTKDQVTMITSRRLLEKAPTPQALAEMDEAEVARLAYPAGFYKTKAASLKKIAAILLEQYDGEVPADMDRLLALPGVGRKTANLVLIEAFDLPGLCVDTHVHRICNRAGWVATKAPDDTESALRRTMPRRYWKGINALLVLSGQNLCKPISPICTQCVIAKYCKRLGVGKSR